jgi:hypothetical protein
MKDKLKGGVMNGRQKVLKKFIMLNRHPSITEVADKNQALTK